MSNRITTILKGILPTLVLAAIGSVAATIIETMGVAIYIYNAHFNSIQDFYEGIFKYSKVIASSHIYT